ncbi:hypothetical protein DPMN_170785 [Dreissena polymorpha]|uniref:Uncharacterized protein n=1 Tax=Dreissena polymorpha TaxID=45954 RepID=A0A9D4DZX4_DREPO|nr:hypothetical protein DPMN_170785 [Dreissena polymorpha]
MVHDYSSLKVFWKASGNTEQDSALQVTLDQKAGRLRYGRCNGCRRMYLKFQ